MSADSGSGINGEVTIDSPNTDLNSALQPQDVDISRPATLASDVCTRTTTDSRSTFVRAGRGGVAERPDGYLTTTTADASEDAKRGKYDCRQPRFGVPVRRLPMVVVLSTMAGLAVAQNVGTRANVPAQARRAESASCSDQLSQIFGVQPSELLGSRLR